MLKKLIKNIFYGLVQWRHWKGAVILMYHSVGPNPAFFTVKPEDFEKQLAYLTAKKFKVVPLSELVDLSRSNRSLPASTVVLTFDDGYLDNFTSAWPILKKYNLPASIFVITDAVGKTRTTRSGVTLPMLQWEHIKEMASSGLIEFFPHTHTHPMLDTIPLEEVARETATSKKILEEKLGKKMGILAYPYGRHNLAVADVLRREGWSAAVTVKTGRVQFGDDLFLLKRNSVDSGTSFNMFKGIIRYGRT